MSGRRYLQLRDRAWLHQRYVVDGLSFVQIARQVGCSEYAVGRAVTTAGIPKRPRAGQREYRKLADQAWLQQRYVIELASTRDIADEVGCAPRTVLTALSAAGITPDPRRRRRRLDPRLLDEGWLRDRYVIDGWDIREIAAEAACSDRTVRKLLSAAGIARRGNARSHQPLGDREWLHRRYVDEQASVSAIAEELGCHSSAVYKAMTAAGIPRRGRRARPRHYPQLEDGA